MKTLLALCIVTLCLISSYAVADKCPENSWRHRHLRLGIFYTERYYKSWKKAMQKEGAVKLSDAVKGIAHRLSDYFSAKHFGNVSITFEVEDSNVLLIDDKDLLEFDKHHRFRMYMTARRFCEFAQKKKKEWAQTWDFAFLLTDTQLRPVFTAGAAANVHTLCSPNSCAVINFKSALLASAAEFSAYPKLLAYFLGVSLGLNGKRRMGLMKTRRSGKLRWSKQSRRLLARYLDDPLEFQCLRWSCGAYDRSGEVFSRPRLVQKLNKLCSSIFPSIPAKLDRPKTNHEFHETTHRSRLREYANFLRENRYWYRLENMCKGVPCVLRQRSRSTAFTLYEEDMEGEWCGEKKECQKGACVKHEEEVKEEKEGEEEEEEEEEDVTTVAATGVPSEVSEAV